MNRRVGFLRFALLAGALWASSGCVTDQTGNAPLIILFNQAPEEGCVTTPNKSGTARGSGIIDALSPQGYLFTPLVQNTASTNGGSIDDTTRLALVEGANIRVEIPAGGNGDAFIDNLASRNLTAFSQRFSFAVFPDDGLTSMGFEILPAQFLETMRDGLAPGARADFSVFVQLFGTMGGGDVRSNEFVYPVTVCNGCIGVNNLGACGMGTTAVNQGGFCRTLQDTLVVDCCTPAAGGLRCPATSDP